MGVPVGMGIVGRVAESATLYDALAAAALGQPQVVLVAGDAGIGKTTLVNDLLDRAASLGFFVTVGHCLDIEAGIFLGPVVEAARSLLEARDVEERPHARRLATLLAPGAASPERHRLLDDLRLAFLEAAARGPIILALEDLHWAGRSTQDFVAVLSRTAKDRLLLVVTLRSDDLHRGHPVRALSAELSRLTNAVRLDLAPLDGAGIAALVARRTGQEPAAEVVRSVLDRSEGNPLYAEELVDVELGSVPSHLSDLLLAHVDALSDGARSLLRLASVDGSRLDTNVLLEVSGLHGDTFDQALRESVDGQVLRLTDGQLGFRHGLLREAVYDDLLPDERTRTHAAYARALADRVAADPGPRWTDLSRLAFHWSEAGDLPRSLAASVTAGKAAKQYGALEALGHLERALSIWDQVPDAESVAGIDRISLVLELADTANEQGDMDRWHALTRAAVDLVTPETPRLVASSAFSAWANCYMFPDGTVPQAEAVRRAVELAGDEPSEELARALTAESVYFYRHDRFRPSVEAARRAAVIAREVGSPVALIEALRQQSICLDFLGDADAAVRTQEEVVRVACDSGQVGQSIFDRGNLAWLLMTSGDVERGTDTARSGLEEGRGLGVPAHAAMCGEQLVEALVWQGRFADADELLTELHAMSMTEDRWRRLEAEVLIARGEGKAAAEMYQSFDVTTDAIPDPFEIHIWTSICELLDDLPAAATAAAAYLSALRDSDSPVCHTSGALAGHRVLALAGDSLPPEVAGGLRDLAADSLNRATAADPGSVRRSFYGIWLALAEAFAARLEGASAVEHLRRAVGATATCGAYVGLEPRLLLAEELLAHADRDEGRELLTSVWSDARGMEARGHEQRAVVLATKARVPLSQEVAASGPLARLTPREREVLDLLAEGATNRDISGALFISEKTASVHVSNLLAKLGVPNRGAAAALAHRLGLR